MALSFPCFKVSALTRINANTVQVSGLKVFIDVNSNGSADLIHFEPDFLITQTPLDTAGKIGNRIVARVNAIVTALTTPPSPPESILQDQIGNTYNTSLVVCDDPDTTPGGTGS